MPGSAEKDTRRRLPWVTFCVMWALLSLFPFVPKYHGDVLYNTHPLLFESVSAVVLPSRLSIVSVQWIAGHLLAAAALTALVRVVRTLGNRHPASATGAPADAARGGSAPSAPT